MGAHEALLAWCAHATGGRVERATPLPGGNRRRAWAVDLAMPDGRIDPLFLRFASAPNPAEDPYDLPREARLYLALAPTGVCLPRIVATHPQLPAVLIERVAGEAGWRTCTDEATRVQIAQDFMAALHHLHVLDASRLGLGPVRSIADHVRDELAIWQRMYTCTGRMDALIELAFQWLTAHVPEAPETASVVHGDAGPGNFMFAGARLAALIDWELWHLGDPVEDLAWLSVRSVLEPFPQFAQRIREYEVLAGRPLDRERLRYHRIFVVLRIAVIRHRAEQTPSPDSDPGHSLVSRLVNRRLLLETLSQALGLPVPAVSLPSPPPSPRAADYQYLIGQLRDSLAPALSDPMLQRSIKGMARVLKHLQQHDHLGAAFAAQEREDLQATLGTPVADVASGRALMCGALRSKHLSHHEALHYLQRQVARESALGSSALGQLAQRSFDVLKD